MTLFGDDDADDTDKDDGDADDDAATATRATATKTRTATTAGALDKEWPLEGARPWMIPYLMRAVAVPTADPQLEFH